MSTETNINLYEDQRTLFSSDKSTIIKLKRLGVPIKLVRECGVWFDFSDVILEVKVKKLRGIGFKSEEI